METELPLLQLIIQAYLVLNISNIVMLNVLSLMLNTAV